jgi:hypothetical protein
MELTSEGLFHLHHEVSKAIIGKSYQERICLYSAKKRELESANIPVIGDLHQELIFLYRV